MSTESRSPSPKTQVREPEAQTFVETALKLGGKSEEEARKTGTLDRADDQVEALFAARYQTAHSPVHRAVWDHQFPVELFVPEPRTVPPECERTMDDSLEVVRRHRDAGTLFDADGKITESVLDELGAAGYWGLLIDPQYGGQGAPFAAFARFLTRMATIDPTVAGLASVHGCIGAVDPLRTFGTPEQKQQYLPAAGQRREALGLRPDRARRRLRPDRPADDGRRSTATITSSTARSCSSPTPSPAGPSAWSA